MANVLEAKARYVDAKDDLEMSEDTRALVDAYKAAVVYINALEQERIDEAWRQEYLQNMRRRWTRRR